MSRTHQALALGLGLLPLAFAVAGMVISKLGG